MILFSLRAGTMFLSLWWISWLLNPWNCPQWHLNSSPTYLGSGQLLLHEIEFYEERIPIYHCDRTTTVGTPLMAQCLKPHPILSLKWCNYVLKTVSKWDMVVLQRSIGHFGFGDMLLSSHHLMFYVSDKVIFLLFSLKHMDNFHLISDKPFYCLLVYQLKCFFQCL